MWRVRSWIPSPVGMDFDEFFWTMDSKSEGSHGFKAKDGFDLQPVLGDRSLHVEEVEDLERRRVLLVLHRHQKQEAEEQSRRLAINIQNFSGSGIGLGKTGAGKKSERDKEWVPMQNK
ncbi:hypothetical protein ACFX2C_010871 [Malus domestica]